MKDSVAIKVHDLRKSFDLPENKITSVKQLFVNIGKKRKKSRQNVLRGVSFEIKQGDFLGIVGRNGSGKSTLLKLLAGVYTPDEGTVEINGSLIPFIELGVGFNPELTGRDNVFLNGALLGFTRKQMMNMYDDIVLFAELEEHMDKKLKNYSSGMQVRLAFSIAVRAKGDILVLDEVLAVGDEAFQRKCNDYFFELKKNNKTVILVTHSMDAVRKFCNRALLLRDGEIVTDGLPDRVADEYSLENLVSVGRNRIRKSPASSKTKLTKTSVVARIKGRPIFDDTDILELEVKYKNSDTREVYAKIVIYHASVPVMANNAKVLNGFVTNDTSEHVLIYKLPLKHFNQGEVKIVVLLVDSKKETNISHYGYGNEAVFTVKNTRTGNKIGGLMKDQGSLELIK